MTENVIMTKLNKIFSVISKQLRSVAEPPPKKNRLKHSQVRCMSAAPLAATPSYSIQSNHVFNELIQFGEDGLSS